MGTSIGSLFRKYCTDQKQNLSFVYGSLFGLSAGVLLFVSSRWNRKLSAVINIADLYFSALKIFGPKLIAHDSDTINAKRKAQLNLPIGPRIPVHNKINIVIESVAGHKIPINIYRPIDCKPNCPIIVYLHGGGFVVGNAEMYEPITTRIADETKSIVAAIDYRKAPEFKFPCGPHDCIEATRWLYENCNTFGADPDKLVVLGDSAGGNLTIIVTCELYHIVKLSIPIYPVVFFGTLSESKLEYADAPILTYKALEWYNLRYFSSRSDLMHPFANPLVRNLTNLPRTHVITAECDVLVDEGKAYVAALQQANVNVTHKMYMNTVHGFFGAILLTHGTEALLDTCRLITSQFEQIL